MDVLDIKRLQPETSICRELVLVKLKADVHEREAVFAMVNVFRAKVVDVSRESVMVELIGNHSKINAFIDLLEGYEILELARTGVTGLSRGTFDVKMYDEEGNLVDYGFQ